MRRHSNGRDRGSAAVEFVLVLPVLLLILFSIVDFGRMLHAKLQLAEAAREGVRSAALLNVDDGRSTIAKILGADAMADLDPFAFQPLDGCRDAEPGQDVSVTLTYRFRFVTPLTVFAGLGDSNGVTLTQTAVMPCL